MESVSGRRIEEAITMAHGKAWYENPWTCGTCGCCLGCVVLPLVLVALLGGGLAFTLWQTGVVQEAGERAKASPALLEALGEPVEVGFLMQGEVNVDDEGGRADFSLPVSGPRGEGRLHVRAEREAGEWVFSELYAVVEGRRDPIDLLQGEAPQQLEQLPP
jgi:hypothetical protein